jgi:hypothetical protein
MTPSKALPAFSTTLAGRDVAHPARTRTSPAIPKRVMISSGLTFGCLCVPQKKDKAHDGLIMWQPPQAVKAVARNDRPFYA